LWTFMMFPFSGWFWTVRELFFAHDVHTARGVPAAFQGFGEREGGVLSCRVGMGATACVGGVGCGPTLGNPGLTLQQCC
jgi:hypothetical protein